MARTPISKAIPVIDLFAGPGGLGEGFCALADELGKPRFRIALSIEKDSIAHRTLELRSFHRQFPRGLAPNTYYEYLRGETSRESLFRDSPKQAIAAAQEAWNATLGEQSPDEVDDRIRSALAGEEQWVLIGGPPCQAYSIVGRSRVGGINPDDTRVYLYQEYLRILAQHAPPVFVMENVKGLLSSRLNGEAIFDWIRRDLEAPTEAVRRLKGRARSGREFTYRLRSLVTPPQSDLRGQPITSASDFVIRCERYGIPQSRHRVIILGIRDDVIADGPRLLQPGALITAEQAISGLPPLRSGLSKESDGPEAWCAAVKSFFKHVSKANVREKAGSGAVSRLNEHLSRIKSPANGRGGAFVPWKSDGSFEPDWFHSPRLGGVCNHETRGHIVSDLFRYLYAATFAQLHGRSPDLREFPDELLPDHENARAGDLGSVHFADRFRVQVAKKPATTITSHISKDGHYYVHFDPRQCRSFTVREAARIQTFPDDYLFEGNRTEQYRQVGNAVPPRIAREIARVVGGILR